MFRILLYGEAAAIFYSKKRLLKILLRHFFEQHLQGSELFAVKFTILLI
jgi:hypothetical protein